MGVARNLTLRLDVCNLTRYWFGGSKERSAVIEELQYYPVVFLLSYPAEITLSSSCHARVGHGARYLQSILHQMTRAISRSTSKSLFLHDDGLRDTRLITLRAFMLQHR